MEANVGTGGQLSQGQQEQSLGWALPAAELEPMAGCPLTLHGDLRIHEPPW